jgi:iron complex outermembrane receptor protein
MELKDKIVYAFNPATGKSNKVNLSEFTNKGVEYNFQYFFGDNWELSAGGYWGDPVGKKQDKEYQAGPKFQVTPAVCYHGEKLTANLNATFITSRANGLRFFQTVGVNLSYKIWRGVLTAAVDNIFDRENVINGKMSPVRFYEYYDMPLSFRIGYRFEF